MIQIIGNAVWSINEANLNIWFYLINVINGLFILSFAWLIVIFQVTDDWAAQESTDWAAQTAATPAPAAENSWGGANASQW